MNFNAKEVKNQCVEWIRQWFENNGKGCNAVIGISGGKDSSIVAALCVEALGADRVIGILMPNGEQKDISDAVHLIEHLDITGYVVDVSKTISSLQKATSVPLTEQSKINLPPRIRMAALYMVSQSLNGRVANTCNLSEDWVGYSTRYGDSVGDFSPLSRLTVTEVRAIGYELGLPKELIEKVPADGLCDKTDEDNLGFTYATLDRYIREGVCEDIEAKNRIDALHEKNKFKLELMPCFEYDGGN